MARIRFTVELDYDAEMMHGGDQDQEAREWFFNQVLGGPDLALVDLGDVGDELGRVRVVSVPEEIE